MTQIISTLTDYQKLYSTALHAQSIGFVPTMGALHEGHLHILKKSLSENDITICSIFVNPTQFNSAEDLDKYPKTFEEDLQKLSSLGVDYVFAPKFEDMYPDHYKYKIEETDFSKILCGAGRPGHFDGVLTVVMKLFNIIRPTHAYFGEKDFQQLSLVQGMVDAFFMNVKVVPVATVRDDQGLALSSRNTRLSAKGLQTARDFANILKADQPLPTLKKQLQDKNIEVEYLDSVGSRKLAAVWIDGVRLIDNV